MKLIFALLVVISFGFLAVLCSEKEPVPICLQPKEVGPCRKAAEVYFFNKEKSECEGFIYGGCLGNQNRFETKQECEKACLNKEKQ